MLTVTRLLNEISSQAGVNYGLMVASVVLVTISVLSIYIFLQNNIVENALYDRATHYTEKLTLTDVADKVYGCQWPLSKLIAKNTEQSLSDLLNGACIAHVKKLLKDSALKAWEISEVVSFADVTHFSCVLKSLRALAPTNTATLF